MSSSTQFTLQSPSDEGFYVAIGDQITVYESYDDAVADIQTKLTTDTESFLAEVAINAADVDDVAVTLEQVSWQQIIRDMAAMGDDHD